MKKLLSIILSIIMLLSMATIVLADGIDGPKQKPILTVGVNAEFFPFEYYDGEELKGFDIELMNRIGEKIGYEIKFVNMPFDKLIPAVNNGEIECAISAITVTEEREKVVDFTTPYISTGVLGEYESYAVVFPEGSKVVKNITVPEGKQKVYLEVDQAIRELVDDATVEKLLELYEVEKHFVVDDEDYDSEYIELTKDDAAFVMDILKLGYEKIGYIHLGRVNAEQYSEFIKIEKPVDVKAFYNKFSALPFVEKSDNYDGITIQFRTANNGVMASYYTTYGIFIGTFGANNVKGKIEDLYVSEQELYKIIDELGYEWKVFNPAYVDTSVAEPVPAPSDWAKDSIDIANAVGITNKSQPYYYHNNITREEFCELIHNFILSTNKIVTAPVTDSFTDTKNVKILMLNGLGIVNGKTATEFAPNDYLTREEAATIIVRMVNKIVPMAATEMWFEYDDITEISDWASDSIQTISNLGFMNGVGNNRFAPKDTYTTEQAIVTLVRVLEKAGASGLLDEKTSIGIIGGADGPTSIIVGDNVTVIEDENYDNFYVEVKKNMVEVDDFYIDEAIKLIVESGKLASDRDFISLYTSSDEMTSQVLELGAADYSKPSAIYHLSADKEQIIANIEALAGEEIAEVDLEKLLNHRKLSFAVLPNLINASYGPQNLAAISVLTNSRGYIMPEDFKDTFALYFEYEDGFSALVTFAEFGDGVISANMSFVNNGLKDNIFRRVFEITQGLGEDTVKIALVQ